MQMAISDKLPVLPMKDKNVHRSLSPELRDKIKEHITKVAQDDRIPCSGAITIARLLGVNPADVGMVADELRIKISKCQLGCF